MHMYMRSESLHGDAKRQMLSCAEVLDGPMKGYWKYVEVNVGQTRAGSNPSCASATFEGGSGPLFVPVFHRRPLDLP